MNSDQSKITTLLHNWANAALAHDLNGVLAHHAPDILMFDVVGPLSLKGIDAYKASWPQVFQWLGKNGHFALRDLNITAGSDLAFATAFLDCKGVEMGKPVAYTLRLTVCLAKQNGQWLVLHEHHSEPLQVPEDIGSSALTGENK
jgi:ketosteroid isomerase-like protein